MTDPGDPKPDLPERAPASPAWLLWLIPLAVLIGIVWFVLRGDRSGEVDAGGGTDSEISQTHSAADPA